MVLLYCWVGQSACGWYAELVNRFVPSPTQTALKNGSTDFGPMSVSNRSGMPYGTAHSSVMIWATSVSVAF